MPQVNCSHCNTEMYRQQCLVNRNSTGLWFCNKECRDEYYIAQNTLPCAACGKLIYVKPYRLKRLKKAEGIACSSECRCKLLGWLPTKVIECDQCGKSFERRGSIVNNHHFCSRKCMGAWLSENRVGENSPSWLGGYEDYYGKNWERQRRKAYKRDCATCQSCGITETEAGYTLDVHHKKPFRLCADYIEANQLTNLITLCHDCHRKAETYARWLFNPDRRKSQPFHPLQNHSAVSRVYLNSETDAP